MPGMPKQIGLGKAGTLSDFKQRDSPGLKGPQRVVYDFKPLGSSEQTLHRTGQFFQFGFERTQFLAQLPSLHQSNFGETPMFEY